MKAYKDESDDVWLLDLMKTERFNKSCKNGMPEVPEAVLWMV
jgi:hypothetical protein